MELGDKVIYYLSHPYTTGGEHREINAAKAHAMQVRLRDKYKINIINPLGIVPECETWQEAMKFCHELYEKCDAVILSSGWVTSQGCRAEATWAIADRKPIFLELSTGFYEIPYGEMQRMVEATTGGAAYAVEKIKPKTEDCGDAVSHNVTGVDRKSSNELDRKQREYEARKDAELYYKSLTDAARESAKEVAITIEITPQQGGLSVHIPNTDWVLSMLPLHREDSRV